MPVPVPGQDLHLPPVQSHRRLSECVSDLAPYQSRTNSRNQEKIYDKDLEAREEDDDVAEDDLGTRADESLMRRCMRFLAENGVEGRGVQPVPEDERVPLKWWSVIPQFTLWAAANTNILTFSSGALGPNLYGLPLSTCVWTIIVFTFLSALPVAYFCTLGPVLGMRQMVQARYAFGYFPALLPALCNCITMLGFLAINAILGGQTLALASGGSMSWNVGIVVVGIISLLLSFLGLRALHYYSMALFPIILVLYLVIIGVSGSHLHLANEVSATMPVTAGQILGYGATLIGFTIPYASLASDFTTYLPKHTPRVPLFFMVLFGLCIPIICLQIFGAAVQLAAQSIPAWQPASEVGVPNLLYSVLGEGHAARFVMVLFAFSVTANTAPTIYSCGLSSMIVFPFLARVPRYFMAVVITAIIIPVAIVGANNFYVAMENFLLVLSYWTAIYVPIALIETLIIRGPPSLKTFPAIHYNEWNKLPMGLAAIAAMVAATPVITAGMAQTWWLGWIAKKIPEVGYGDLGFELGFVATAIVYLPCRVLEKKYTGR